MGASSPDQLNIDIETFSSINIKKAGLYKYVQSPDFQILLFSYSLNRDPVRCIDLTQGEPLPSDIVEALADPLVLKKAFNATFEWYCLNKFYYAPLESWRCTMLHSLYCGYPGKLDQAGPAIGIPADKRKLSTGNALIKLFSTPTTPSKKNGGRTRTLPHHEPEKWQLFKEYNIQDVEAEMEIDNRLSSFPVPAQEQKLWELDQQMNDFGVSMDPELIEGALQIDGILTDELMREAKNLSGLDNPKSVKQLSEWVEAESGLKVPNLQAETVTDLIEKTDGSVSRVLEIRQELAKASVSKYAAMREAVCSDGRIRGLLQFYGANRTGRWAGRLVQIHNLPKNHMNTLDLARELVKSKKLDSLKMIYGNVANVLSQLIRTAFVPSQGNTFMVADFSAIEARVIAWLAGEQWRLEVFKTHGKIYEASASQMFGVPIENIDKGSDLRQRGKVSELALGYQGGKGALIQMGALDQGIPEEELPEIVKRWRSANKRIVDLWYSLENAALDVMHNGQPVGVKGLILARESELKSGQDFLTIQLPSKRKLYYAKPFLSDNDFGKEALHYYSLDQKTRKWAVNSTYGGKLVENAVQAIARDCLAESLIRLRNEGYPNVFHVHDEIVADVPPGFTTVDRMTEVMGQPISWAPGLLLKAAGFETSYYMKD